MRDLAGKMAVDTGAGMGIGQSIAVELARRGAGVAIHYAHSEKDAHEAAAEIERLQGKPALVQGDLSKVGECERVVDEAADALGRLDVLVNNAGVTRTLDFLDTDEATYDEVFDLNIKGYFFCARRAVPFMRDAGGGSIVNITSIHGHGGVPAARRIRGHKGCDQRLHPRARDRAGRSEDPGQRHRPRYHRSATLLRHPRLHHGVR